jgi:hypothetical protein
LVTSLNSSGGYCIATYSNIAVTGGSGTGMIISMTGVASGYLSSANITTPGTGYINGDTITIPAGNPVGSLGGSFVLQNYNATKSSTQIGTGIWTYHIEGNLTAPGNITIASNSSYFIGNALGTTAEYTGNVTAANLLMSSRTVKSTSTTVDLFDDTTLNINAFGAATDINIGVNNAAARFGIKTPNIWFDNLANLATYSSNINVFNTTATGVNAFGAANTIVFGANTSSTTFRGNVTAANFIGNISITGNVTGTSSNVTLQAGSYSSTFNNQGNVILPNLAVSGNVISGGYFLGNGALLTGVATKITGSWTVPTGNSTQSFTVASGTYQLWVDCNIPNGILAWNATATVTNSNVPVVGVQYAWVYNGGGTPIDFTSIPNQFVGTGNTIVRNSTAPSATTNRFDFGINNTSGGNVTVSYGYVKIS